MVSDRVDIGLDWKKTLIFLGVVLVFGFFSVLALTGGKGLDDPNFVKSFNIYLIIIFIGAGWLLFCAVLNSVFGRKILRYPLHEPEDTLFGRNFLLFKNPLLLLLWTVSVFALPLFLAGKVGQTFFTSIPQQITTFSSLFGSSVFPSLGENLVMFIPISGLLSLNFFWFYKRYRGVFWLNNFLFIPLIMAFVWRFFHNAVYGTNELSLLVTFVFGFIGVFLTLFSMSFIPWFVLHFLTNFFIASKDYGLFANDVYTIITILIWIGVVGLSIFLTVLYARKGVKKKQGIFG